MIVKLKMLTTGKILVEMSVPEIEMFLLAISEEYLLKIWVCNKTCYFYIYTWDCNVSWTYKHKD